MRFQERWRESGSEPFEFEGKLVHSIYRRLIKPGTMVDVEFLRARPTPPQGIELKALGAKLAWDEHDVEGQSVRLWADKQNRAAIRYVNSRKTSELRIWNIWLDEVTGHRSYAPAHHELVQAWWAWSGMLIDEVEDGVVLRCSGSYDGPNFDDLTVKLTFRPRG
jgi:hypothetical protein